jgi:hypothetical protein
MMTRNDEFREMVRRRIYQSDLATVCGMIDNVITVAKHLPPKDRLAVAALLVEASRAVEFTT